MINDSFNEFHHMENELLEDNSISIAESLSILDMGTLSEYNFE